MATQDRRQTQRKPMRNEQSRAEQSDRKVARRGNRSKRPKAKEGGGRAQEKAGIGCAQSAKRVDWTVPPAARPAPPCTLLGVLYCTANQRQARVNQRASRFGVCQASGVVACSARVPTGGIVRRPAACCCWTGRGGTHSFLFLPGKPPLCGWREGAPCLLTHDPTLPIASQTKGCSLRLFYFPRTSESCLPGCSSRPYDAVNGTPHTP